MNFYYEEDRKDIYIGVKEPLVWPAHFHKNIELAYIVKGNAHASADGNECYLKKGDFFIAFPESVHYYDECKNTDAVVIIVSPDLFPEYADIFLSKQPAIPIIRNAPSDACRIIQLLECNRQTYSHHTKKGLLLALLGILFANMKFVDVSSTSHSSLQEIINYCSNNYKSDISVRSMSKALHISPSYISHTFSGKFNTSFREYINTLRLIDSERLLKNSRKTVAEIAFESGFESIRTFNRVFKDHFGLSPAEYRKKNK